MPRTPHPWHMPCRTAHDTARESVRTTAPARLLVPSGALAAGPDVAESGYRASWRTNVKNTITRLRKQLSLQEQTA